MPHHAHFQIRAGLPAFSSNLDKFQVNLESQYRVSLKRQHDIPDLTSDAAIIQAFSAAHLLGVVT